MVNIYKCIECDSIEIRNSKEKKIKSYCTKKDVMSKLIRVKGIIKISKALKKLYKIHVEDAIDTSKFSKKEIVTLKGGFKLGVISILNEINKND